MACLFPDTIHYKDHPHYDLFMVRDHPFIPRNDPNQVPMIRSLIWQKQHDAVLLINQKIIPQKFGTVQCKTYHQMSKAIKTMTVRGAPAIGAAGAYGMALAAIQFLREHSNADCTPSNFVQFMQS